MKWKQGWNGLLISGMLGAGGILMISGGTAAIPRTDYSYAAETAAGTEKGVLHRSRKVRQKVNSGQKILVWKKQIEN